MLTIGFDPRFAALANLRQDFIDGIKEESARSENLVLAGEPAVVATDTDGTTYVVWIKRSLALVVVGDDRAQLERVATPLIEAGKSLSFPTS